MSLNKVVVTGVTGGLGLTACEMLLEQGVEVVGIGRRAERVAHLKSSGLNFRLLDLAKASSDSLEVAMRGADAVWHCAARTSPWGALEDFYRDNVIATKNVVEGAVKAGVPRFVHVSSPAVYFNYSDRLDVPERGIAQNQSCAYSQSRLRGEHVVTAAAQEARGVLQAVVLRPGNMFGPHDESLLPRLMHEAKANGGQLSLPNRGRTLLDMTYLDNVVAAMWRATTGGGMRHLEVMNITNGEPVILGDLMRNFSRLLGAPCTVRPVPYPVMACSAAFQEFKSSFSGQTPSATRFAVAQLAYDMTLDTSRARRVLAYQPHVSVEEGLHRTAEAMLRRQSA